MLLKRVIVVLCLAIFLLNTIGLSCYANNTNTEKQREQLQQKINTLSRLERKETNKLSKNQQKLEKNQKALQRSKDIYDKKQANITNLQKELNSYIYEYNRRNKASAERSVLWAFLPARIFLLPAEYCIAVKIMARIQSDEPSVE